VNSAPETDALVNRLYETAFARLPTTNERALDKEFLRQATPASAITAEKAWTELCHVLLNVKEFIYIN
jgi:hypothetical protein